jgi:hypothetical protein
LAERAKAHVLARQNEVYPETTIADVPPEGLGRPPDGIVLTLKVANTKERERFVVLRIVARTDGPVVLWSESDYARRPIWEAEFRKLVGSFKLSE